MSSDLPAPTVFLFFALAAEAKAFVEAMAFKKNTLHAAFEVYQSADWVLTITGVGKVAMAAGVAYTLAHFSPNAPPVLVNIGIAGHQDEPVGALYLADKITDRSTARHFYPQYLPKLRFARAALLTVDQPEAQYAAATLYDMEASAFYEVAARFTHSELLLVLKVISDNQQVGMGGINAKQVKAWVAEHVPAMTALIQQCVQTTVVLQPVVMETWRELTQRMHFTVTEKHQLQALLQRWQALTQQAPPVDLLQQHTQAGALLKALKSALQDLPVVL